MLAIIPAAGFGTRMGMRPDQSKELLPLGAGGGPLIQDILWQCEIYNLNPLVITRKEKKDLIEYCEKPNVHVHIIRPKGEWYDTVLASKRYWEEDNILILPDTRFSPATAIYDIEKSLELGSKAVFALHKVSDGSKWGTIKDYSLFEKYPNSTNAWAWGVIGFKKDYGEELFNSMREKKPLKLKDSSFLILDDFQDVTRG